MNTKKITPKGKPKGKIFVFQNNIVKVKIRIVYEIQKGYYEDNVNI